MNAVLPGLSTLELQPPQPVNVVKRGKSKTERFSSKDLSELKAEAEAWLAANEKCCGEPTFRIGRGYLPRRSFNNLAVAIEAAKDWPETPGNFMLTVSCNAHD